MRRGRSLRELPFSSKSVLFPALNSVESFRPSISGRKLVGRPFIRLWNLPRRIVTSKVWLTQYSMNTSAKTFSVLIVMLVISKNKFPSHKPLFSPSSRSRQVVTSGNPRRTGERRPRKSVPREAKVFERPSSCLEWSLAVSVTAWTS